MKTLVPLPEKLTPGMKIKSSLVKKPCSTP